MMIRIKELTYYSKRRTVLAMQLVLHERGAPSGRSAVDAARDHIARLLDQQVVHPGETLPSAKELAAQIGVSRPVVLEALHQLENQGWVRVQKGRSGIRALSTNEMDRDLRRQWITRHQSTIGQMAKLREVLEPAVIRFVTGIGVPDKDLAKARSLVQRTTDERATMSQQEARSLDTEFHLLLVRSCDLPILYELESVMRQWVAPAFEFLDWSPNRWAESDAEHMLILGAIENQDPDAASEAAEQHISKSTSLINDLLATADGPRQEA